jgi:hypothetical protein
MIDPLFTEVGTEDEESEWAPVVPPAAPAAEIAPESAVASPDHAAPEPRYNLRNHQSALVRESTPSKVASQLAKFDRQASVNRQQTNEYNLLSVAETTSCKDDEYNEPSTYEEAMASPDAAHWKVAMLNEITSLHANGTWELMPLPHGSKAIAAKWVFKIKRDAAGNIERYKARLVVKGFAQREGIDFNEVYAPVSKHTTLRALLSIVCEQDLELRQVDVTTAFLNGDLDETIYMVQPPGFEESGNLVCHLRKSLYGLRQAPRQWHIKLKAVLEEMGFFATDSDPGLFIKSTKAGNIYLLVYVDDLLIASANTAAADEVLANLRAAFDIRDLGNANMFIGMKITRNRGNKTLKIDQSKMTHELLNKYGMTASKAKSTPLAVGTDLVSEEPNLDRQQFNYSELIGSLLYLSVCTRPDIRQAVGALARFMSAPSISH